MNRLRALVCTLLAALPLSLSALTLTHWTDPETGITWKYTLSNGNASIGGGSSAIPGVPTSYAGSLTIPATLNGSPVVALNPLAFYLCSSLTSVNIPSSVTAIGHSAFDNCSSLTSVNIPSSVTAIGDWTFYRCSALTSVDIPEGVTAIGKMSFYKCSALTSIVIPSNVTSIGEKAFYDCSALTSIVIPEGVASIGGEAFAGCTSVKTLSIAATVSAMPLSAFPSFNSLESIRVAEGSPLYWTENNILYNAEKTILYRAAAKGAVGEVVIPSSVTAIGEGAFDSCSALTSVVIPASVTSIGNSAFSDTQCKLVFLGRPPREGLSETRVSPWGDQIVYPEEYAAEWEHALQVAQYSVGSSTQAAVTVTAVMTTPKTMKVTYNIKSPFTRAKVRAVAWKDGARSFANIIPVKTAAEGSPETVPNGETVTTGVEHTFIWQVSNDWSIDLAKVAVEVLAEDAGLLPQDLVTIPATETHVAMTITTNVPTTKQLFNALVWHYADGDPALMVSNGVVKINGTQVASGSSLSTSTTNATALLNYLYGKLGYKVLSGSDLSYAKAMTRLSLSNSGLTQLSVKNSEE